MSGLLASSMAEGHQQGSAYASSQLGDVQSKAQSTSTSDIPGFKTDSPYEANLDNGSIGDAAMKAAQSNGAATYISEHSSERKSFRLDPNTDPMFVNANNAVLKPEKTMNETVLEITGGENEDELVNCDEGGDEYLQKCSKHLVIEISITPEISTTRCSMCRNIADISHFVNYGSANVNPTYFGHPGRTFCRYNLCNFGRGPDYLQKSISQARKVEIINEYWADDCVNLEAKSDEGLCRYEEEIIGDPETRTIVGFVVNPEPNTPVTDSERIKRDVWEKHYTYKCLKKVESNCDKLRAKGCVQTASSCKEKIGEVCVVWTQTYKCPNTKKKQSRYKSLNKDAPFCFTGDCVDADYEANEELANALTHLAILKEAQDDIRSNLGIFKGQGKRCRKAWHGARDCCGSGNRWAVSWNLAPGCDTQEKELADFRAKRKCVEVGTFCSQKLPIIGCIEKKTTFCCFGTKLSRLIQEQGRRQLGMGFGSPESPECRGLNPDELSRLDFSKMDLSELYEDVVNNFKPKSQDHIAKGLELERIRDNMKHLSGGGNKEKTKQLEAENQKKAGL
jgi:conjugal transfer mating pair stabilization protein TraN